jgi:hypothetical protein
VYAVVEGGDRAFVKINEEAEIRGEPYPIEADGPPVVEMTPFFARRLAIELLKAAEDADGERAEKERQKWRRENGYDERGNLIL